MGESLEKVEADVGKVMLPRLVLSPLSKPTVAFVNEISNHNILIWINQSWVAAYLQNFN